MAFYQDPNLRFIPYSARPFTQRPSSKPPYNPGYVRPWNKTSSGADLTFNYDDPFEINSLADALLNRGGLDKLAPRAHASKATLHALYEVPWQQLQGIWHVINQGFLRPVSNRNAEGKWDPQWDSALRNAFINLAETSDFFGNAFKGWAQETADRPDWHPYSWQGFIANFGFRKDLGRKNYDWDFKTGWGVTDFIANLAAEIISDPFNWISMGGAIVSKSIGKVGMEGAEAAIRKIAAQTAVEFTDEQVTHIAKRMIRAAVREPDSISRAAGQAGALAKRTLKSWTNVDDAIMKRFTTELVKEVSKAGVDGLAMGSLQAVRRLVNVSEGLEKTLMHTALATSGIPLKPAAWLLKTGAYNPAKAFLENLFSKAKKGITLDDTRVPLTKFESLLKNWESVTEYKMLDPSAPSDSVRDMALSMRVEALLYEQTALSKILMEKDPAKLRSKLDEFFLKETGELGFDDFVTFIDDFAKKYPNYDHFAAQLRAVKTHLDTLVEFKRVAVVRQQIDNIHEAILRISRELDQEMTTISGERFVKKLTSVTEATLLRLKEEALGLRTALRSITDGGDLAQAYTYQASTLEYLDELIGEVESYLTAKRVFLDDTSVTALYRAQYDVAAKRLYTMNEFAERLLTPEEYQQALQVQQYLMNMDFPNMTWNEVEDVQDAISNVFRLRPKLKTVFPEFMEMTEDTITSGRVVHKYVKNPAPGDVVFTHVENLKRHAARITDRADEFTPPASLIQSWGRTADIMSNAEKRVKKHLQETVRKHAKLLKTQEELLAKRSLALNELDKLAQDAQATLERVLSVAEDQTRKMPGYNVIPPADYQYIQRELGKILTHLQDPSTEVTQRGYLREIFEDLHNDIAKATTANERGMVMQRLLNRVDETLETLQPPTSQFGRDIRDMLEMTDIISGADASPYQQLIEMLEGVQRELSKLDLEYTRASYSSYLADETVYHYKLAQAYSAQLLMKHAGVDDLLDNVLMGKKEGALLKSLHSIPEFREIVEKIQGQAFDHQTYRNFLNTLFSTPELDPLQVHLFDTIEGFKVRDLDSMLAYREYYISEIIKKLQAQVTSIEQRQRFGLDVLFGDKGAYTEGFADWAAVRGFKDLRAHDARTDILRVMYMLEAEEGLETTFKSLDHTNKVYLVFDIETTGTETFRDQILQISWRRADDMAQEGNIFIRAGDNVFPSEEVLRKTNQTLDSYKARHFDPQLPDEGAALQQFMQEIDTLREQTGKQVVLVAHNGTAFDQLMITNRMRNRNYNIPNGVLRRFETMEMFDTLTELHKKHGIAHLTEVQTTTIRNQLLSYFSGMEHNHYVLGTKGRKFINTVNGNMAGTMEELAAMLKQANMTEYLDLEQSLRSYSKNIWDILNDIGKANDTYRMSTITMDADKIMRGADGKILNVAGALFPTQLFAQKAGDFMLLSTKMDYRSTMLVKRFFKNIEQLGPTFSARHQQDLFYFSKAVERVGESVKRMDLAGEYYDDFARHAEAMKATMLGWYRKANVTPPKSIELFDTRILGTVDRYAATQKLQHNMYKDAEKYGFLREYNLFWKALEKDEAAKILRDPRRMFQFDPGPRPVKETFPKGPWELNKTVPYSDNEDLRAEIIAAVRRGEMDVVNMQDNLALLKSQNRIDHAMTQMTASVLERLHRPWQRLQAFIEGVDEDTLLGYQYASVAYGNRKALAELEWMLALPTDELKDYLWYSAGVVTFSTPTWTSAPYANYMNAINKRWLDRAKELADAGVTVYQDKALNRMFLFINNDELYTTNKIAYDKAWKLKNYKAGVKDNPYARFYVRHTPLLAQEETLPREMLDVLEELEQTLADLTDGRAVGTMGDMFDTADFEALKMMAPPEIRKMMIPIETFKEVGLFEHTVVFNRSNVGLISGRREINKGISNMPFKNYMNAGQTLAPMLDGRIKARYLFFDDLQQLNGPLYKDLSDEDIVDMLRNNSHVHLAGLVEDKKYGAIVKQFHVGNAKDVAFLRSSGVEVSLLPSQSLLQAYKLINNFDSAGPVLRFLQNYLISPLKAGYLSSIGFMMRNLVDSTLKNIMMTGSPTESGHMLRHTWETWRVYKEYQNILRELQDYADDLVQNKTHTYSKRVLDRMYEINPNRPLSKDMFQMVHDFISQGPSAGLSKYQYDVLRSKQEAYKQLIGAESKKSELFKKLIWENPWTRNIMNVNGEMEQIFRLSGYTWEIMHGSSVDKAMDKVLRYHFDYGFKTKGHLFADYFIPFSTFVTNNMVFWVESLDKIGWLAGLFGDFLRVSMNPDGYDSEELKNNRSLQYHILAGNIVFPDGVVFKLNPSIMDAVQLLTDPTEAKNRVVPWIRIPVDLWQAKRAGTLDRQNLWKTLLTNLPGVGPFIQKGWQSGLISGEVNPYEMGTAQAIYERTGKWFPAALPSVFGGVLRQYYFGFPGNEQIYMTKSKEKFEAMLNKGALAVDEMKDHTAIAYLNQKVYPRYARKYYAQRYYAPKKPRRTYQKKPRKIWVPKVYHTAVYAGHVDLYAGARVLASVRNTQFRMPNSNRIMMSIKPALVRRLYTGSGQARFKSRLVPVTAKNLATKLKSGWSNLR